MNTDDKNKLDNNTLPSEADKITAELTSSIANSDELVRGKLVEKLLNQEIDNRVELLYQAITKLAGLSQEITKLSKSDSKIYNKAQEIVFEGLSEERNQELTQVKNEHKNLELAIDCAISKKDYSELKQAFAQK